LNDVDDAKLCRELNNRFVERTEIHPNRIVFHAADEIRRLQGVGTQLKEQKIIDNRPGKSPTVLSPLEANGPVVAELASKDDKVKDETEVNT
jgi:hypothetical protein